MSEQEITLLSVRADAQVEVAPDEGTLECAVEANEADKPAALRVLTERLNAATAALAGLGGVARTPGDERRPLVWLVRAVRSEPEMHWDEQRQVQIRTGRVIANASLLIAVRDFPLLDRVSAALASLDEVHMRSVGWSVDHDNPAWRRVRASAIDEAIVKGRDYASALGGTVLRVEHVADVGLLGDGGNEYRGARAMAASFRGQSSGFDDTPSLDPVPQELHAGIEARFTAAVRPVADPA